MEQGKTIPRLHEAGPGEGEVDNQAEGEGSQQQNDRRLDERLREEGPGTLVSLQPIRRRRSGSFFVPDGWTRLGKIIITHVSVI
jgi:hypothetical protein